MDVKQLCHDVMVGQDTARRLERWEARDFPKECKRGTVADVNRGIVPLEQRKMPWMANVNRRAYHRKAKEKRSNPS